VTLAYIERTIPLVLTLVFGAQALVSVFAVRTLASRGWLAAYQRGFWPLEVALAVLILAQVATWRGWSRWLRLFLYAGGIVLLVWAKTRVP
jgi:hypothetical protein